MTADCLHIFLNSSVAAGRNPKNYVVECPQMIHCILYNTFFFLKPDSILNIFTLEKKQKSYRARSANYRVGQLCYVYVNKSELCMENEWAHHDDELANYHLHTGLVTLHKYDKKQFF